MQKKTYNTTLTIAGSDPSGGAGIQADLKTFSALGCYGMSVITALTAQNTQGVTAIHSLPAHFIQQQLDAVLNDINVNAIKIGMLDSADIIETVANTLIKYPTIPIVLDPVMVAKSGHRLLKPEAVTKLKEKLLPLATIITPNIPEAEDLLNEKINHQDEMATAAIKLSKLGPQNVLIKGGHLDDQKNSPDCLFIQTNTNTHWFDHPRITTKNTHGTGCTLSSAIAAHLALGKNTLEAVTAAKQFVSQAIQSGSTYQLGHGHGPVNHFFA